MTRLIPTILCGGAGSRLWPVSRELHPKPFIRLSDGQSLLQKAFLHGASLAGVEEILTVTNREIFFKIEDELQAVNHRPLEASYILEPLARNTAAAITMAALYIIESKQSDAVILILSSDHLILHAEPFQDAVDQAVELAKTGKLVTFGIQPTCPDTGYGYIEAEGNRVVRFVEKPCFSVAEEYVASGRHFWNSGMFCFTPDTLLQEMNTHCADILDAARVCLRQSRKAVGKKFTQIELEAGSFSAVRSNSIDYALMEKSSSAAIVPCDIGWRDIGSWNAISDLSDSDDRGNKIVGKAMMHDSQNCYVQSLDRMVGMVGVEDLIVIDTADAVLVARRDRAQDVRHLYAQLKTEDHESHKLHRTVHRPWGFYTVLEEGEGFKIKRIEVKPGASLSLQVHQRRSEHWIVVSGRAKVVNGDREFIIETCQSTYIPAKNYHRLSNLESSTLIIIEVQSGDYLGEDDIVRLEDVYGRV